MYFKKLATMIIALKVEKCHVCAIVSVPSDQTNMYLLSS